MIKEFKYFTIENQLNTKEDSHAGNEGTRKWQGVLLDLAICLSFYTNHFQIWMKPNYKNKNMYEALGFLLKKKKMLYIVMKLNLR